MTDQSPQHGPFAHGAHPRNPADAWVIGDDGQRYWGLNGAAGLLALDPARGVLLQHRAEWSHHGGTWGLPGGARHEGEDAVVGALREAKEEADVPSEALAPRALHLLDLEVWTYTTVIAEVVTQFEPRQADAESLALEWVAPHDVDALPLHPGFAAAWPTLQSLMRLRPVLVVDAANVVGARPDGWWRDRRGATSAMLGALGDLAGRGVAGGDMGVAAHRVFPRVVGVVEGQARGAESGPRVEVVEASGSGDDAVVAEASRLAGEGAQVTVVTSDRGLRARLPVGVRVQGAAWLRDALEL